MRAIGRVKKQFVEVGLESILERRLFRCVYEGKVDVDLEAKIVSLCCSKPPDGYTNWSYRLLVERIVELEYVDYISHVTAGKVKKNELKPSWMKPSVKFVPSKKIATKTYYD